MSGKVKLKMKFSSDKDVIESMKSGESETCQSMREPVLADIVPTVSSRAAIHIAMHNAARNVIDVVKNGLHLKTEDDTFSSAMAVLERVVVELGNANKRLGLK